MLRTKGKIRAAQIIELNQSLNDHRERF